MAEPNFQCRHRSDAHPSKADRLQAGVAGVVALAMWVFQRAWIIPHWGVRSAAYFVAAFAFLVLTLGWKPISDANTQQARIANKQELLELLKDIYPWRKTWDDMALEQIVPPEALGRKLGWVRENHLVPLRIGIAHALLRTGEVRITLDKMDHIQRVNRWLLLCRALARLMLKNEFPQEFGMAMKSAFAGVTA